MKVLWSQLSLKTCDVLCHQEHSQGVGITYIEMNLGTVKSTDKRSFNLTTFYRKFRWVRLTYDPLMTSHSETPCDLCSVWLGLWPSQSSRGSSGLRPCKPVSVTLCPATRWPRRSGLRRPTSAVQIVEPPNQTGPLSTCVWSSANAVQVQNHFQRSVQPQKLMDQDSRALIRFYNDHIQICQVNKNCITLVC